MKIDDIDTDYETVKIDQVGIIDPLTGAILFKDETVVAHCEFTARNLGQ